MIPKPSDARTSSGGQRRRWPDRLLIVIALGYAFCLVLGPLVAILWGALSEGLWRFLEEVGRPDALSALRLTLILGVGATLINTVFGVIIAWVLVRDKMPGKKYLNAVVDLPFAVSPVIAGLMLILLFGRGGWLTPLTDAAGIKMVFALPGMLLATAFVSLPFVVRELVPVLAQLGTSQEETAYTMGAGAWRTFWRITLPAARWGLLYGVSLTLARAVGEFGAVLVVSGGVSGLTETATLYIFRSLDDRNYVGAYSIALVLALISFTVLIFMEVFKKRGQSTVS
jgi:sulfate/thiosulfate transport system permease protein